MNSPYIDLPFFATLSLAALIVRSSALSLYSKARLRTPCTDTRVSVHASDKRDISGSSHCSCPVRILTSKGLTFASARRFIRFTPPNQARSAFYSSTVQSRLSSLRSVIAQFVHISCPDGTRGDPFPGNIRSIEPRLQQQVSRKLSRRKFTIHNLTTMKNRRQLEFDNVTFGRKQMRMCVCVSL